jgi:radical SAM superfamily enzyme YgiQ (UPF0313 family)
MAARLRQYGAEVSIIDLNAYRINDESATERGLVNGRHLNREEAGKLIEDHFNKYGEPDIIGLSGKITTLKWQQWVSDYLRKIAPEAFLISGGGLATEFKVGLFNWIPALDAIGHSEGDDIVLLCAHDVKRSGKNRTKMLDSPYYHGEVAGKHRFVYAGDRPHNLDNLPFAAWDLFEHDVYGNPILEWYITTPVWGMGANNSSAANFTMERSLTTVSSRGCPHACSFCYRGAQGERNWGIRSPANLREEAEWLIKTYGVDFIGFPDDNFAVDWKRCQALPQAFEGLAFRWGTHTRLDECTMNRLTPMAESGCIYIGVGAESASKATLYRMKKGGHIIKQRGVERMTTIGGYEFPTTMIEGIQNCREVGIHTNATWIMAYPGENLEDLKTSVAFIKWQEELYTQGLTPGTTEYEQARTSVNKRMFTATAYPGTDLFKDPKVQELLHHHFGLSFDGSGDPICDSAMEWYVQELDDATKVLHGRDGSPLNFSSMSEKVFLEARSYIDSDQLYRILDM